MEDCSYTKYDLMKQLVSSIVHPVNEIKEDYKELIYNSGVEWGNAYVSCKEINDITPFLNTKLSVFADLVEDLLQDRGTILDYEYQQNENCYDFWIKCKDGEVRLYKLFDAKNTIIDVRDYQPTDW